MPENNVKDTGTNTKKRVFHRINGKMFEIDFKKHHNLKMERGRIPDVNGGRIKTLQELRQL